MMFSLLTYPNIHKITDKIYLGNQEAAYNKKTLKDRGITHVLVSGNWLAKKYPQDFIYHSLPLNDIPQQDLFPYFQEAFDFIDSADKILIHCAAGVSRSSSMTIAYLMYKFKWNYSQAFDFVKRIRIIICPNPGFVQQLKRLDNLLQKGEKDFSSYQRKPITATGTSYTSYTSGMYRHMGVSIKPTYRSFSGHHNNNYKSGSTSLTSSPYKQSKYDAGTSGTTTGNTLSGVGGYKGMTSNYGKVENTLDIPYKVTKYEPQPYKSASANKYDNFSSSKYGGGITGTPYKTTSKFDGTLSGPEKRPIESYLKK